MKIPFLKPGTFTSLQGKEVKITKEMLDEIVEATNSFAYQDDSFPLVIGHPKLDSPAYGWIKKDKIVNENGVLVALASDEDINESFIETVKQKLYKNVSVKLRKDKSIAHIGFLGAKAPAVTGLPAIAFAEELDSIEVEFSEYEMSQWPFTSIKRLFRQLKNYIIEKEGTEKANVLMQEYEIEDAGTTPSVWEKKTKPVYSFSEEEADENANTKIQNSKEEEEMKELDDAKAALTAKETELAEANAKLKEFTDKQAADALAAKKNEFVAFCESDEVKLKIKDAEKDEIVSTLLALDKVETFEFGEGEEKRSVSAVDVVKGFITRLPNLVETGEKFNSKNSADDKPVKDEAVELAEEIEKLVDEEKTAGRTISYAEASQKVKSKK